MQSVVYATHLKYCNLYYTTYRYCSSLNLSYIMSSSDVRSILDLPSREDHASSSTYQQNPPRRSVSTVKKPDGISRELYALIGDNAPFLAETQAALSATKYRERPKPKIKDARWYALCYDRHRNQLNL
jgi:hypothetical protein